MRKLLIIFTSIILTVPSITQVMACSPENTLKIAFVPSINSLEVMKIVKPLEKKLSAAIKALDANFNQKVSIQATTNYEAAGQALQDGKVALAFLPMGTYTKYWGQQIAGSDGGHSDLAPLVIAQRWAMKPDQEVATTAARNIDFAQSNKILNRYNLDAKGTNSKATAYQNLYTNDVPTAFYRSQILANNDFLAKNNTTATQLLQLDEKTYKATMRKLVMQAVADDNKFNLLMSDTSGAGVIYPLKWLIDIGFDPHSEEGGTLIRKILYSPRASSYSVAAQNISNQTYDMTVGYTDIRADIAGDNNVKNAYNNSSIVGITNGIYNDGISYSKLVIKNPILLDAIRHAFKNLINDAANKKIFAVYQHTDYLIPQSIEQSPQWEAGFDHEYQDNINDLKIVYDILNDY